MHKASKSGDQRGCAVEPARYLELLEELCRRCMAMRPFPDSVVGVKRSGLFPAVYLSERLDLAMFTSSELDSFPAAKFRLPLLVDTTCWSGGSMRRLIRRLEAAGAEEVRALVMFARRDPYPDVAGLSALELADGVPRFWYTRPLVKGRIISP